MYLFVAVQQRSDAPASLILVREAENGHYALVSAQGYADEHFRAKHHVRRVLSLYDVDTHARLELTSPESMALQILQPVPERYVWPTKSR